MNQENRTDPMIAVFPRVTKCTFHKFGPSGSIQTHDALCILALNILNEKIFIFLWFWLIILSALSGLALLYSSMLIVLPSVREIVLKHRFRFGSPTGVPSLIRKTQVSKFFVACACVRACVRARCKSFQMIYINHDSFLIFRWAIFYSFICSVKIWISSFSVKF